MEVNFNSEHEHTFPFAICRHQEQQDISKSGLVVVYDNELNKFVNVQPYEVLSLGDKTYEAGRGVSCYGGRYYYLESKRLSHVPEGVVWSTPTSTPTSTPASTSSQCQMPILTQSQAQARTSVEVTFGNIPSPSFYSYIGITKGGTVSKVLGGCYQFTLTLTPVETSDESSELWTYSHIQDYGLSTAKWCGHLKINRKDSKIIEGTVIEVSVVAHHGGHPPKFDKPTYTKILEYFFADVV